MSNSTPRADAAKTKWAPSKRLLLYALGVLLAVFAVLAPTLFYQPPTARLQVNGHTLSLEIAESDAARERGLGGRKNLAENKGMVFIFDKASRQCFWMKGMEFPLDMVFMNAQRQITTIRSDISPKTYPKNYCADDTKYVIELNAGEAARLGLHPGQTLSFS